MNGSEVRNAEDRSLEKPRDSAPKVENLAPEEDFRSELPKLALWPSNSTDRKLFAIALVIIAAAIVGGAWPVPEGVDPYARVNLMVLGLVVASWIVGLCSSISTKKWGSFFGAVGLIIWYCGIYFSSSGVAKSVRDMVTFW